MRRCIATFRLWTELERIGYTNRIFFHVADRMPRYIPDGPLATNKRIAEDIFTRCYHMELESAPSYKIWAYRRAGWTVDELDQDVLAIYKKRGLNGLKALPNIGPSIAAFIAEKLDRI